MLLGCAYIANCLFETKYYFLWLMHFFPNANIHFLHAMFRSSMESVENAEP